ncbi:hypothetical protein N692_08265 [Lactiplantibacillus plantarum EGD-AQ4]|nr:hypothetical protein N692_08265 [Lactiplantibacillus plantarum EGD-AQ4]
MIDALKNGVIGDSFSSAHFESITIRHWKFLAEWHANL